MSLRIAKLKVSLNDCQIQYNNPEELETTKARGSVLTDGKIVRGLGTHFANKEAKDRFDRLTSRANAIREEFSRKFARGPFESTFIVSRKGEAIEMAQQYAGDQPDITVTAYEVDLSDGDLELTEWTERLKQQAKRFPLGRAETASDEGLSALEGFAECPVLSPSTKEAILNLVKQARSGDLKRVDLKRNIELLQVELETAPLMVPRTEAMI